MSVAQVIRAGRSIVTATLIAGSVAGCEDPFSPYWDRGTYDLRYANNDRVPTVISAGPGTSYTEVRGGALTLRRDHSYQLIVQIREQIGGQVFEFSRVFAGPYESEYRTLYLTYVDSDSYSRIMVANWRDGYIELVVPEVDGRYGVLCRFGN